MRENTYWLIIVLRKGHAFKINETNGWGEWQNAQQLNYDAAGGGDGEASSGINSTFRGVNVRHHQRRVEEKEKWFCCQRSRCGVEGEWEGIMTPGCCCTSLNSTDRENRQTNTHTEHGEQTKPCTQRYTEERTGPYLLFTICAEHAGAHANKRRTSNLFSQLIGYVRKVKHGKSMKGYYVIADQRWWWQPLVEMRNGGRREILALIARLFYWNMAFSII